MVLGLSIGVFAWLAMTLSTSLWVLYLTHFIHGVCKMLSIPLAITYMVETADKNSRGWQNGSLYGGVSVGLLVPAITTMGSLSWRQTGMICCVLSLDSRPHHWLAVIAGLSQVAHDARP